ncbi:MAG: hypothetical protein AAGA56_23590 [Myxococcota bacterium]
MLCFRSLFIGPSLFIALLGACGGEVRQPPTTGEEETTLSEPSGTPTVPDDDRTAPDDDFDPCSTLVGSSYESLEELECGLGPDEDVVLCHWGIQFLEPSAAGVAYRWQGSDYGEEGFVTCEGLTLRFSRGSRGRFIEGTRNIVYNDVEYARQPVEF